MLSEAKALPLRSGTPSRSEEWRAISSPRSCEAHARRILEASYELLGIGCDEIRSRKANDEEKVSVAEVFASETSMRLDWLREELGMGSRSHCIRLINDQRRRSGADKALQKRRARILRRARSKYRVGGSPKGAVLSQNRAYGSVHGSSC